MLNPKNIWAYRRYLKVAAFAVGGAALGALLTQGLLTTFQQPKLEPVVDSVANVEMPSATNTPTLPAALPTTLHIEKIDLTASFEAPLGLQPNNEIAVPEAFDTVGYYQYGPTPGELGPAVVLGHVDSYLGPAVFWRLGELTVGDQIKIKRADGTVATFAVTSSERHEQSGFPTEQVYSDIDHAGLRLITCSGSYDRQTARYSHNLIVFAKLLATSTQSRL